MKALVSGSNGLVGSATVRRLLALGYEVVGLDDNSRGRWFGDGGDTTRNKVERPNYTFVDKSVIHFAEHNKDTFDVIVHCAAQPSHELANEQPLVDFEANVVSTVRLLEQVRQNSPEAIFIHLSTTKVYGDEINTNPNWPIWEEKRRYISPILISEYTTYSGAHGIFGANKLAADVIVQEYGKEYGLQTVIFRPGCITGKDHAGVRAHGFLSYLAKCIKTGEQYIINGYDGKQVRDQIHVEDLVDAFVEVINDPPTPGEVFVIGGGIGNSISVLEAVDMLERMTGKTLDFVIDPIARKADHKWNVHDNSKFQQRYPNWKLNYDLTDIMKDLLV